MDDLFDHSTPQPSSVVDDEFWSARKTTAKTGISRSTLYVYVRAGHFPQQRKLGPRRVGWLASEIRVWMATRPK